MYEKSKEERLYGFSDEKLKKEDFSTAFARIFTLEEEKKKIIQTVEINLQSERIKVFIKLNNETRL